MRDAIPEGLKRKVRQRCGFGCVLCGSPIYDYEHINEYADVKEHTLENITLLCPGCHRKKTKGIIGKDNVIAADKAAGKRTRTSPDDLPVEAYSLDVGGNIINAFSGTIFDICEFGFFQFVYAGVPYINALIIDENKVPVIEIKNNIYTLSSTVWDIEYVGKTLTFRNGPGKIFFSITIDGELKKITIKGKLILNNGVLIDIRDDGIYANKKLLAQDNIISQSKIAVAIENRGVTPSYCFNGKCSGNFFEGLQRVAAFNSYESSRNIMVNCLVAFLWNDKFLYEYANDIL